MEIGTPTKKLRDLHLNNVARISSPLKVPSTPLMKQLGYGTGVSVYRLERSPKLGQTKSPWAIKHISRKSQLNPDKIFRARLLDEAEILRKLKHPNIVGFRGIASNTEGISSLALECCKTCLGTILEDRFENVQGPLPAKNTIRMIIDISKALDYLHTEAKLLHGDLKSFNILVKGDFEICKLCDFGVSLALDENGLINFKENPSKQYIGTDCWSAPEVIDNESIIDCKADIFSFGLVLYETISLVPPHTLNIFPSNEDIDTGEYLNDKESNCLEMSIAYGTRPPLPQAFTLSTEYNPIVELFYCCTNEDAENRPMAKNIWESFENMKLFD